MAESVDQPCFVCSVPVVARLLTFLFLAHLEGAGGEVKAAAAAGYADNLQAADGGD